MNIENNDANKLLNGSSDADYIANNGDADYIANNGDADNVTINAGAGDDTIENGASYVTVDAGEGNDSIVSGVWAASLNGGVGDDHFEIGGWDTTVKGGAGNDYIRFGGIYDRHVIEYADGDGDDTIDALSFTPIAIDIKIMSGAVSSYEQDGDNFILHIGSGSITIKNAYGCRVFDADGNSAIIGYDYVDNYKAGKLVEGTSVNDWIYNEARNSTLNASDGNDVIDNSGARVEINGGAGKDKIYNQSGNRNTINGGEGNDVIVNLWEHTGVLINGDAGNDLIENWFSGDNSTINGGDGDDTIRNNGASVSALNGDDGNDLIENWFSGDNSTINGGDGDDTIRNNGASVSALNGDDGNDLIESGGGDNITMNGGAGDDTIYSDSNNGIVKGDAGDDSININSGSNVFVEGGDGDDQIETNAEFATIRAGKGDDYINLRHYDNAGANVIQYSNGDGYDVIYGFNDNDTFYITDGSSFSTLKEGSDVVIEVDGGAIILEGAAGNNINIVSNTLESDGDADIEYNEITNAEDDIKVNGTSDADHIVNTAENVTIQPNAGNDVVEGSDVFADLFVFSANDGNNTVTNFSGEDSLQIISGTISTLVSDNDLIISAKGTKKTAKITLQGIADKPFKINNSVLTLNEGKDINSTEDGEKIVGTNGDDFIEITHQDVTVKGGKGNDTIDGSSYGELIQFGAGDGNDLVTNFGKNDTLQITGGTMSTVKNEDDDLVVTVKNSTASGTITLVGAGSYKLRSDGEFLTNDDVNYINNTKDNRKVTGTTGDDYISNSGENVTIQAGKGADTIEGSNLGELYLFSNAAGNNVILNFDKNDTIQCTAGTISAIDTVDDDVLVTMTKSNVTGTVLLKGAAKYQFKKSGAYITVDDVNVIDNTYDKKKITGTTKADLIINTGENVTIQAGAGNDTIEDAEFNGNTFLFSYASGDDVIVNFGKGDTLKSTAGSISNVETVDNDVVVTITKSGQSAVGTITLKDAASLILKQSGNAITVDDVNVIDNTSDKKKVTGTTGKDYISNSGENVTVQAGAGDDTIDGSETFGETFLFSNASGDDVIVNFGKGDTLKATSGSISNVETVDNDVVVTITKSGQSAVGTITLKDAASLILKQSGNAITVDDVNVIDNTSDKKKVTGTTGKDYISNSGENVTVQAGAGDDTIDGAEEFGETYLFSYASGDDIITNFGANDTLKCTSGSITAIEPVDGDMLITMTKGKTSGTVLIKNAASYIFKQSGQILTVETVNEIKNTEDNKRIVGTNGKDYIENTGEDVTIVGSAGLDTITGSDSFGELYQFTSLNGGNVITNFGTGDTLQITKGSIHSTVLSEDGNDLIISLGSSSTAGSVTLQGAGAYVDLIKQSGKYLVFDDVQLLVNQIDNKKVSGSSNRRSYIINTGENATLSGGGSANDTIEGTDGTKEVYMFAATSGEDLITNFGSEDTLYISAGSISNVERSGNDYIVTVSNGKTNGTVTLQGAGIYDFEQDGKKLTVKNVNYIFNQTDNKKVTGTSKDDFITNDAENVSIQPGKGNDTVYGSNYGEMYLFSYAAGNNVILNFDKNDTLKSTAGTISAVDTVDGDVLVTIRKGSNVGTVTLKNAANFNFKRTNTELIMDNAPAPIPKYRDNVKIVGTAGRDYIINDGENVTIQPGKGNDTVTGSDFYGETFLFSYASGDDVITNFGKNDTLKSTSGTLSYAVDGDNAIVTITKSGTSGTITLEGAGAYDFEQSGNTLTVKQLIAIENETDSIKITGTSGDDYIVNTAENVSIQPGKGNDTVDGSIFGETFMFSYAAGDNIITNFGANDTLRNTSGTMTYAIDGDDVVVTIKNNSKSGTITLQGAATFGDLIKKTNSALYVDGLTIIENTEDNKKVTGTAGRDYIANTGEKVTIQAGKGNDIITGSDLFGETFLFSYASGDDTITNFGLGDTLKSTSGTLSYKQSGNDYIVSIKNDGQKEVGTVTLQDAAANYSLSKSGSNLIAKANATSAQLPSENDYWFLDDSTVEETPLNAIVEKDHAVDLPSDFNDAFKQSTIELAASARSRQIKSVK